MEFPMRINKYLAHTNQASRREADALISAGKVLVNGQKAQVGQQIHKNDTVELIRKAQPKQYYLYYKPRGIITHSPAPDETDIVTQIARDHGVTDVSPIGRLDKDSEGLILLSNDGRITGPLLDPARAHEKEYDVTVDKEVTDQFLRQLERGVNIEGYVTKPAQAEKVASKRFRLTLTEGKKHQIRRMCAALGYQVQRLKRVRILTFKASGLEPGDLRRLTKPETISLLTIISNKD